MQWGYGMVEIVMKGRVRIVMIGVVLCLGAVRWVDVRWVDRPSQ